MSELTAREQEYISCETPMITAGQTVKGLTAGLLIGLLHAALAPGYDRGDRKLIGTTKLIRYTRYKKAVLRKHDGMPKKHDEKLLKKLNSKPFVLEAETYDPDAYTAKIYEEYMREREQD